MYRPPLVPHDFAIPDLVTANFRLEPLGLRWLAEDFAAVTDTIDHLDGKVMPPSAMADAPAFTIEDDLIELAWHQREFRTRQSFAWIAVDLETMRSRGCAYLFGSPHPDEDAVGFVWARWDPDEPTADEHLYSSVRKWVTDQWPLRNVGWPGRSVPWDEWLR